MQRIHSVLKKYNIVPNKLIKINNTFIVDDKYAIKPNLNKEIYKSLNDRNFDYYPKLLNDYEEDYLIEEYISEENIDSDIKLEEMIDLISLLHNKTTFYKKVDISTKKEIYENVTKNIFDTFKYYDEIMIDIESKEIFSPSENYLAKNISLVFLSLNKAKEKLDIWYNNIKDIERLRYAVNHNNLSLNHFIKGERNYLISWNKAKKDIPIYDLYNFFMNNELDYELVLEKYMNNTELLDYEKELLYIILLIPPKLSELDSEFDKVKEMVIMIHKLNIFNNLK